MVTRAEGLLDNLRSAVSQILGPPRPTRPPVPPIRTIREQPREFASQDVLAGVCAGVALRDLNLVDSLLAHLERMEAREDDPDALAELYRLDHLATRLRRNAENLRVLSGRDAADNGSETQNLVDVIRAAMSSIEQYARVTIGRVVSLGVVGFAADDLGRLLAELLDNATNSSPPLSPVRVSAHLTEHGSVLLRIEDEGIGLPSERLTGLNARLASSPALDRRSVQEMGLAVVGRLAHRHKMRVRLDRRTPNGTIASVLIPTPLVCDIPDSSWSGAHTVGYQQRADHERTTPGDSTFDGTSFSGTTYDRGAGGARSSELPASTDSYSGGNPGAHTVNGLPRRRTPVSPENAVVGPPPAPSAPDTSTPEPDSRAVEQSDHAEPDREAPQRDVPAAATDRPAHPSPPMASRPDSSGTTANGLPRRVPRSLKNPGSRRLEPPRAFHELAQQAAEANHDTFIADLGAFTDGTNAAARDQHNAANDQHTAHDRPSMTERGSGHDVWSAPEHSPANDPTSTSEGHEQ